MPEVYEIERKDRMISILVIQRALCSPSTDYIQSSQGQKCKF